MSHLICLKNNINYIMDFFCIMVIINMISSVSDLVQMIKWSISTDAQLHHRMYGMWILLWKFTNKWQMPTDHSFAAIHFERFIELNSHLSCSVEWSYLKIAEICVCVISALIFFLVFPNIQTHWMGEILPLIFVSISKRFTQRTVRNNCEKWLLEMFISNVFYNCVTILPYYNSIQIEIFRCEKMLRW